MQVSIPVIRPQCLIIVFRAMLPLVESELIDGLSIRYLRYYGQLRVINEYRTRGRIHSFLILQIILTAVIIVPFTLFQFICPLYIDIDIEKATILTLHTLSCIQSYAKPGVFLFYAKIQSGLFDVIRRDLLTCIPPEKQAEASRIYKKISSRSNLFCFLANFTNFLGTSAWCSSPGIRSEYIAFHVGNMNEVTTGPVKILGGWYPIPFTISPWAEMVYFYEILVLLWCCIIVSLYECMLLQLVMSLYAHFQVLGYHLSTLRVESSTDRNFMYEQYLAIIQDHQKLLRYLMYFLVSPYKSFLQKNNISSEIYLFYYPKILKLPLKNIKITYFSRLNFDYI